MRLWVIHDFNATNGVETNYFVTLDFSENDKTFTLTSIQSVDHESVPSRTFALGVSGENNDIKFPLNGNNENLLLYIRFKGKNAIQGYFYTPQGQITNHLVGMRKNNGGVNNENFGVFSLKEYDLKEDAICNSNLELIQKGNCTAKNPHLLSGRYYNFVSLIEGPLGDSLNQQFGNEKSFEIDGEMYQNSAVYILRLGTLNYIAYEVDFGEETNKGIWFRISGEEGTLDMIAGEFSMDLCG